MNCIRALFLGFIGAVGFTTSALADSVIVSGFVTSVGSNLGTSIDGTSPNFADRDFYTITLTYNSAQAPRITTQGVTDTNNAADYYLLETNITIFADDGALTWTYATPAANSLSHSFGVQNNVFGNDKFSAGLSGVTFSGPTLGPGFQNFSHWSLNFTDYEGTISSDTSIPNFSDLTAYNFKDIYLQFGIYTEDRIELFASSVSVIPESSAFAMLAGTVGLAAVLVIRRRRY
ncbi:hypothetical protein [Rariglobus hedericola]|uniref:PEP-CTERM sorting domain-containing protein n=1 Tax=Rariglobus hedericola TaxID=2597822 RepID=A0A556QSR5_9BACT|nr:hypothetical protein [Rariglobus hedericola]TSJ79681.1 hypothetical protein FPL22_10455 [Rariglobus hedericola]